MIKESCGEVQTENVQVGDDDDEDTNSLSILTH